jgi:hypothetical protein
MKNEFNAQFDEVVETLIKRGYATPSSHDANGRVDAIDFTSDGNLLIGHLRRLFDIPKVRPTDLTPDQITSRITAVLLLSPHDKL